MCGGFKLLGQKAFRRLLRSPSAKRYGIRRHGMCQKARIFTIDGTLIDDTSLDTPRIEDTVTIGIKRMPAAKPTFFAT
jgi:hypothetical protein